MHTGGSGTCWGRCVRTRPDGSAEYGREPARVHALDGPLLPGRTPTETAGGSQLLPHQLPTQATDCVPALAVAPTQRPGLPPATPARETPTART